MRKMLAATLLVLAFSAPGATGQKAPTTQKAAPDDLAFITAHMDQLVQLRPERLGDAAVASVFAPPIYRVNIIINDPAGNPTTSMIVARSGDTIVPISAPGEERDCPEILKLLRPAFRLNGDAAATTVQSALDAVFPVFGGDVNARAIRHSGREWTFVRGKFFDNAMGFVLTTDATGRITGVRWALKLPA